MPAGTWFTAGKVCQWGAPRDGSTAKVRGEILWWRMAKRIAMNTPIQLWKSGDVDRPLPHSWRGQHHHARRGVSRRPRARNPAATSSP
ncbi:hypothetical protein [Kibdelosporangium philippinense]|uniref:hypothetical protein n=1 Tax=Kibdelosporangium philippinense TaxID=211113 RepID=UPI003612987B